MFRSRFDAAVEELEHASCDRLCERFTIALAASRSENSGVKKRLYTIDRNTTACVDDGAWLAGDKTVKDRCARLVLTVVFDESHWFTGPRKFVVRALACVTVVGSAREQILSCCWIMAGFSLARKEVRGC